VNVLVTGGAGFIGSNLCRLMSGARDVEAITVLDDLSTGDLSNLDGIPGVTLVLGSIGDRDVLQAAARGADVIVHLAARPSVPLSLADPVASHDVNVTGTVRVLEAARESGAQVIVASSSAVYGDTDHPLKHESLATRPLSPYGVTKVATEAYATAYMHSFAVPTLALRFFNVYGPHQPAGHAYAAVVPAFVAAALTGRPLQVFGDGRQVRDFVFVGTVAEVLLDAARRRVTSAAPVNLASGTSTDLLELITTLRSLVGDSLQVEFLPERVGDIRDSRADPTRFRQLFPDLHPAPLDEGLRSTIDWFRATDAPGAHVSATRS
jgi:UDP-glucose 4-epimerase